LKGLLYDFINLKKASYKLEADVEKSETLNRQLNHQIAKTRSTDARAALSGAVGPRKSSRGPKTSRHQTTEPQAFPRKLHVSKSQSKYGMIQAPPSFDTAGNYISPDPAKTSGQVYRQQPQGEASSLSKSNSALLGTNGIYETTENFMARTQSSPMKFKGPMEF
jgi:hypothetical protein